MLIEDINDDGSNELIVVIDTAGVLIFGQT